MITFIVFTFVIDSSYDQDIQHSAGGVDGK